jgi:hypothetical protein
VSYRDHRYPETLDLDAALDLYRGPDIATRVKAGLHIVEFTTGKTIGEPGGVSPATATGPDEASTDPRAVLTAEGFDLDEKVAEVDGFTELELDDEKAIQDAGAKGALFGGLTEVVLILKALKLLRDKAPELYATIKALIEKIRREGV